MSTKAQKKTGVRSVSIYSDRQTASGEIMDAGKMTAAHRRCHSARESPSSNAARAARPVVRINDRGPFVHGRVIDLYFVLPRAHGHGHSAPLSIHAAMIAPNSSWVPGAGRRPGPGCHAQPTKSSFAMCSWSKSRLRPPLRAGSLI
jgi:hypothetical protein